MADPADDTLKSIASAARHDLKQSLHVVSLYVQLAQQQLGADHPAAVALERALGGLQQQRDQIRRLQQVAELPRRLRGRAELLEALGRLGERRSLRLKGALAAEWVACPASRLDQLLDHFVGALGVSDDTEVVVSMASDDTTCILTAEGPASDDLDAGWASDDTAAERYLARRLAQRIGGGLEGSLDEQGAVCTWELSLPRAG